MLLVSRSLQRKKKWKICLLSLFSLLELIWHRADRGNWIYFQIKLKLHELTLRNIISVLLPWNNSSSIIENWDGGNAISFAYCGPKDLIARDPILIIFTHYHPISTINHIIEKNLLENKAMNTFLALFICLNLSISDQ